MSVDGSDVPAAANQKVREPYAVRLEEDRWATLRHIVEAVAIVCAGVWAFYTFVYQEKIKPAGEPAALNLHVYFVSIGHAPQRDVVKLVTDLHNTGKTEIDIAADGFNVWGERYAPAQRIRIHDAGPRYDYRADLPIVSRRLVAAFVELRDMAVGGRRGERLRIEPGATETITDVFAVPPQAYDLLHAQVTAIPVKTDRTDPVPVNVTHNRIGGYSIISPARGIAADDNDGDFVPPR
jgi:hypothetical protein